MESAQPVAPRGSDVGSENQELRPESRRTTSVPRARRPGGRVRRAVAVTSLILVAILIVGRLLLPHYVLRYVNDVLHRNRQYPGHVSDVGISLWRGAYQIYGIEIRKREGKVPVPLFEAPVIDLSVEWKEIFHGSLVGRVVVKEPKVHFVHGPTERQTQRGTEANWLRTIRDLFPLKINSFRVERGQIHYRDFYSSPKVDVALLDVNGIATNLTNSLKLSKNRVANIHATARAQNQAEVEASMDVDPFATEPDFYFGGQLRSLRLAALNEFLRAYANVDAKAGEVSFFSELRTSGSEFRGYLKVLIKDLELIDLKKDIQRPLHFVWETLVAAVSEIFTNHSKDQIATEVPLRGTYNNPQPRTWSAVIGVFRNAFIEALKPGLNRSLSFGTAPKNN